MRNKGKIFWLTMALTILLTGCGAQSGRENINAAMTAIENLDYNGALESFEKALVSGEDQQLIYRGQGLAYMGLTQYEEAEAALLKALALNSKGPDDISYDINYYLATAYYKRGALQEAMDVYSAILALEPKETDAYYLRGCVELDNGNYENAKKDFDMALSLEKNNYDMYVDIYLSLEKNGHADVGKEYLNALLEAKDTNISNYNRGRLSFYLEDYESARNHLEEARKEAEKAGSDIILMLGRTYEALEDYNYAASVYNSFVESNPAEVEILNQLGLCEMKLKDYQAALTAFQSGIKVENNSLMQVLKYNEITVYEFLGEYKKAAVSMESYLKTYPDDKKAQREYEFLQTR